MRKFDLEKALTGTPLITRSGLPVQLLAHGLNESGGETLLVQATKKDGTTETYTIFACGAFDCNNECPQDEDVFLDLPKERKFNFGTRFAVDNKLFLLAQIQCRAFSLINVKTGLPLKKAIAEYKGNSVVTESELNSYLGNIKAQTV